MDDNILLSFAVGWVAGLPQSILVFYTGLGLVGARNRLRQVVAPALILSVVAAGARTFPALLGWHVPIFFVLYILLARAFQLGGFKTAIAADALSFILTVLADVVLVVPMLQVFGLSRGEVWGNAALRIVLTWLETGFLIAGACLVKWKRFILIPIAQGDLPSQGRGLGP